MAINFPNSPTVGQDYTSGATTWTWDGVKWALKSNQASTNDSMPVGSIMWFAGSTTPNAWLPANGAAVSRTTYATLFATIGTTYGSGDGSTTFNVPSVAATTGAYYIRYTTSVGTVTTTSLSTAPVGTIIDWPVTSSYPTGWLRADGSAVSRTSYADLFSLIGSTYGSGDGATTFNLPSLVASGSGSPVSIIKASLGGLVEPSTVAHAASHAAGGSDPVLLKQSQISDFIFTTEAARDAAITSPVEGMRAYITAPTIPAATGSSYTAIPTGIQTIYNGSVWVCVTEIGAGRYGDAGYSTSSTSYTTTLTGDTTPISVTLSTGTSALISMSNSAYGSAGAGTPWMSVSVSGATTLAATDSRGIVSDQPAAQQMSPSLTYVLTGLTAGTNTFTLNYRSGSATTTFVRRHLMVKGVA